jgi:transcriptional regulator with XRE-family HTH domain
VRSHHEDMRDPQYRAAYAEAACHSALPYQIRITREQRGWTRGQLAAKAKVSLRTIVRYEEAELTVIHIPTLCKIANALDVCAKVSLISYAQMERDRHRLGAKHLYVPPYRARRNKP